MCARVWECLYVCVCDFCVTQYCYTIFLRTRTFLSLKHIVKLWVRGREGTDSPLDTVLNIKETMNIPWILS